MSKLVVGCGYLGGRVARLWRRAGQNVYATTRSEATAAAFSGQGWQPVLADLTQPESLKKLSEFDSLDTVLVAVGYDSASGRSIRAVYVDGLRNLLAALPTAVGHLTYISSTGVYGQTDSEWVAEDSPCRPTREGGKACLEAEELLRTSSLGGRSIILRMAGLYGPGRIPRQTELTAGQPIAAPSQGYLNLIHVDDAAEIVLAVEAHATLPALYLVSDGCPVLRHEYYCELARLLAVPPPRFAPPPPDSPAALRAGSDKRIDSGKLRREIPLSLTYPTYREGLAAAVASSQLGD